MDPGASRMRRPALTGRKPLTGEQRCDTIKCIIEFSGCREENGAGEQGCRRGETSKGVAADTPSRNQGGGPRGLQRVLGTPRWRETDASEVRGIK